MPDALHKSENKYVFRGKDKKIAYFSLLTIIITYICNVNVKLN